MPKSEQHWDQQIIQEFRDPNRCAHFPRSARATLQTVRKTSRRLGQIQWTEKTWQVTPWYNLP